MSRADLLADLQGEVNARPATPPVATLPQSGAPGPTPAIDVSVTPLQWSLPSFRPPTQGIGVGVQIGPVQVSIALR